jgi:hypothetical protein
MTDDEFYDSDWKRLRRQQPLVAKKLEALRCELVCYEEFEELRNHVEKLESKVLPEENVASEDFEGLLWKEFQGNKGSFQRTCKPENPSSEALLKLQSVLQTNKGFCQIGDYTYWFDHNNPDVIDRRRRQSSG